VALPAVVLAVIVAVLWAAPGGAQAPLTPTQDPLDGSGFQAGDGDQDLTVTLSDWQTLGGVVHSVDANDNDSAFKAGDTAKEDRPGDWALATEKDGVTPGKANILDAWGAVDQRNGRTFVYLAFARQDRELQRVRDRERQLGTTFLAFELNRRARLWDNDNNDETPRVPCRTDGDVLISLEPHGNDEAAVLVYRWETATWDPLTSCATTGHLSDPAPALVPNVDVQGAFNNGEIDNWLGGALGTPIDARLFGEAGIDLAKVLAEAFNDPCLTYTSVWMHSRSSNSEQSNMQDYVAPQRLVVRSCAASGTKFFDSNADGIRDPDEPGVPWFVIFADYNDDGVRGAGEPFTLTGPNGRYVLDDIQPPNGSSYMLRETALVAQRRGLPVSENWICSFPNASTDGGTGSAPDGSFGCGWGPIDAAQEPHARERDFGNWFPEPPTPEPPTPEPPTPATPDDNVAPPGPPPPAAGRAGAAGVSRVGGCLRRGSVVIVRGARIASIRVSVGGERVRGLSVRPEQRQARIRLLRNFPPGRYRVTARVAFQRGSGTPRAVLHRTVSICARVGSPRFTG
jgi:hypothetical protein